MFKTPKFGMMYKEGKVPTKRKYQNKKKWQMKL